jgi:epoxyqueuosine reductase
MLIHKHRGSFFFLAGLLTDLELTPDPPHDGSHCGTCTACLKACPTDAFPEPGVLDARRCISYLTIELRTAIPLELREGVGDRIWGCDICQDVCPWNRDSAGRTATFPGTPALGTLDPIELLGLSDEAFRKRFRGTVFFRARRSGLLRNAAIVLGNVGDVLAVPALELAASGADDVIADAAKWALARLIQRVSRS